MEETTLKCQYTDTWNNRQIVQLPVDKLWASVPVAINYRGVPFYHNVKQDISANGLKFPLLVVECTFSQLKAQKEKYKKRILDLPTGYKDTDTVYVIWGGSNRLSIAKELQYTHVDCVLYPNGDFARAFADQALQRNPYNHLYNGRIMPAAKQIRPIRAKLR